MFIVFINNMILADSQQKKKIGQSQIMHVIYEIRSLYSLFSHTTHLWSEYLLEYHMGNLPLFCLQEGNSVFQELTFQSNTVKKTN